MKRLLTGLCLMLAALLALSACGEGSGTGGDTQKTASQAANGTATLSTLALEELEGRYAEEDRVTDYDKENATAILLSGQVIKAAGNGATIAGNTVTITQAGVYVLSGTLDNGQVIVDAGKEDTVRLIFQNVSLNCSISAPVYAKQAGKVIITLEEGTENSVADGAEYQYAEGEDEPDAAIFCKDSLTINGTGSLSVTGNFNNGIGSKDYLVITGGNLTVTAANNGLRGRDGVAVGGGSLSVEAQNDGIKANNDQDGEKGWVTLDGGTVAIVAGGDGVQAETLLAVTGGELTVTAGGGSANAAAHEQSFLQGGGGMKPPGMVNTATNEGETASCKGIKAGSSLVVTGGSLKLDAADDTLHSNGSLTFSGGDALLSSGDDGMHADGQLTISGGNIEIEKSYEGVEGAQVVISGGRIILTASDDGVNAAGGSDTAAQEGGWHMRDQFAASGEYSIRITGGYLQVNAGGDGMDSNGDLFFEGGTVVVSGPENDGDGSLDYEGQCTISGGVLAAAGSTGMLQAPGADSGQNTLVLYLDARQKAGTSLRLADASGQTLLTFTPSASYQAVILSLPLLEQGQAYQVFLGGQNGLSSGQAAEGGEAAGDTLLTTVTLSGTVTSVRQDGEAVTIGGIGGPGGMGGGRPNNGFGGPRSAA